jgi:hypothetical protein
MERARGWSQFYFVKLLRAHAAWIEAEIPQALPLVKPRN